MHHETASHVSIAVQISTSPAYYSTCVHETSFREDSYNTAKDVLALKYDLPRRVRRLRVKPNIPLQILFLTVSCEPHMGERAMVQGAQAMKKDTTNNSLMIGWNLFKMVLIGIIQ